MKFSSLFFLFIVCFFSLQNSDAQHLRPGFDKEEYKELMYISARTTAAPGYYKDFPEVKDYKMVHRSPVIGLGNSWDLWTKDNAVGVISIRGTTLERISWLANFYGAMVPATGALKLSEKESFSYTLAHHPKAAVHVGWLMSMAFLSKDILPRIDSCYKKGVKEFLLMGHSQGGAINYFLTAHLYSLQKQKVLPADIRFKTYCSAAPKPGNLYFAYEYEALTQNGWAYNVVNTADWVPEMPMTIQTAPDFHAANPFVSADELIKSQKIPMRWLARYLYNQLDKPTRKAQKKNENTLGKNVYRIMREDLPDFQEPAYRHSTDYVRTGATVVLMPNETYYALFPDDPKQIFLHHLHKPYLYLLDKSDLEGVSIRNLK